MNCKNCNTSLEKTNMFCPECGAKIIRNRLTLKNLFAHFSETFLNYDNKFLVTCIDLIKNPVTVIDGYVNGVRKKHINPISFFAISLSLTGLSLFFIIKFYPEAMDFSKIAESEMLNNPASKKSMDKISDFSLEYNSLIYALLIPAFALLSLIIFYKKKYNFTEHIVIYLYTMSLFAITSIFISHIVLLFSVEYYFISSMSAYALAFIYHIYVLKTLFNESLSGMILKTVIFLFLFFISYIIFSIALFILLMVFGIVNPQDFVPSTK